MAQIEYSQLMQQLKRRLKSQGATYATLARTLDVPESTIKKWFVAQDGSFQRITRITEALGLSLSAVMKGLEEERLKTFTFSPLQQQHFLKDFVAFQVFWLLVYERRPLEEVKARLGLSAAAVQKILLGLDRHNLIKLEAHDSIKLPRIRPIRWKFQGPFMEQLQHRWIDQLRTEAAGAVLELQFYQLSDEAWAELQRDVHALQEKYARRTILELSGTGKELRQIRSLTLMAEGSFV